MHRTNEAARLAAGALSLALLLGCGGSKPSPQEPAASAAPAAKKYDIVFERDVKIGVPATVIVANEERRHAKFYRDGKLLKEEQERQLLSFVGKETYVGTPSENRPEYLIDKFTATGPDGPAEVLPAGTKISSKDEGDERHYLVDGEPASPEIDDALRDLLGRQANDESDDAVFGSDVPRAVGEEWAIDAERAKRSLADMKLDASAISGSVKLAGLKTVDGIECLELVGSFDIGEMAHTGLPPGASVEHSAMKMRFLGLFPTDVSRLRLSATMEADVDMKMNVPSDAGPVTVDMKMFMRTAKNRDLTR